MECQTCDEKSIIEDENHILNCENLKTEESVQIHFNLVYGCLEEQLKAVKFSKKCLKKEKLSLKSETRNLKIEYCE